MFDYVFDRGCFHVLPIEKRPLYIREIKRILDDNGTLFLKCFSIKEPRQEGPYKFSEAEIRQLFRNEFVIYPLKIQYIKAHLIHYQEHYLLL
jgi:hypothetical protein